MLWYFLFRVLFGYEDSVELFLTAVHTKNYVDGAFGHVKREIKRRNVHNPKGMVDVVNNSSISNQAISCSEIKWINWMAILETFFYVPIF